MIQITCIQITIKLYITCMQSGAWTRMWDKFDIKIPFKTEYVQFSVFSTLENPIGHVDFKKYDFPKFAPEVTIVDGQPVITQLKSVKWNSVSSGIAGMAVGFFPEGEGLATWPCVNIKASPAKILQGHNVFGSECPKQGIAQMFANLRIAFPAIYDHLDIVNAEIRYTDSTYSARIRDFFSGKVFAMFESLATARTKINKHTDYLQLGKGSEYQRQKLYKKLQEVLADLADARKCRNDFRINILSDQRLLDFATDLHRFEATTGHRKFQSLGIPTKLTEFIKFNDWFLAVHKIPLCRYLWELSFNPLFAQFEGHTMKNVDDSHVKLKIEAKFTRVKDNGRVCKRLANAVWNTYCDIKREGYDTLSRIHNQTFFRNVKHLEEAGLSRAFLKSLDPHKPESNVIAMVQIIKIDFRAQRPEWYVEPMAGYTPERQLRLVG